MSILKYKLLTIYIFISFCSQANAGGWKETVRFYLEKYIGEEKSRILFGQRGEAIHLPSIPTIRVDAKNVSSGCVEKSQVKKISLRDKQRGNYLYIYEVYQSTRGIDPNRNELFKWIKVLKQNGSREGVYRAITLDRFYYRLEQYGDPINNKTEKFAIDYMKKYLGSSPKAIKKINFYTLKREITERSLDLMDIFCVKSKKDLYAWYAVLSSSLARDYPHIWASKLRKNTKRDIHFRWAEVASIQELKSEVIIKIHKVFNFLYKTKG